MRHDWRLLLLLLLLWRTLLTRRDSNVRIELGRIEPELPQRRQLIGSRWAHSVEMTNATT